MSQIQQMTPQQREMYLKNNGVDPNAVNQMLQQRGNNNSNPNQVISNGIPNSGNTNNGGNGQWNY
jgi:predicted secreted protein